VCCSAITRCTHDRPCHPTHYPAIRCTHDSSCRLMAAPAASITTPSSAAHHRTAGAAPTRIPYHHRAPSSNILPTRAQLTPTHNTSGTRYSDGMRTVVTKWCWGSSWAVAGKSKKPRGVADAMWALLLRSFAVSRLHLHPHGNRPWRPWRPWHETTQAPGWVSGWH
jgi:hypothetical protein